MQHLQKTRGGYSSHFGKPCAVMATRTPFSFKFFLFTFLRTLLHRQKLNSFLFNRFRTLYPKTPGWGCPAAEAPIAGRRKERSTCLNLLAAKRLYFRTSFLRCFRLSHWWTEGRRQAIISSQHDWQGRGNLSRVADVLEDADVLFKDANNLEDGTCLTQTT